MTELHDKSLATCSMGCVLSDSEEDAAVVQRVVDEIWNGGNLDQADELFSSTYINHGGLIPDLVKGPEGIKFSAALYRAAFPGLHVRVDSMSSIRGTVRMRWTALITSADHGSGITSGLNVEAGLYGALRSRVAGGQIVESWTSWDSTVAMRRLAALQLKYEETS